MPLLHDREGLVGAVLLTPPRAPFTLDREVFQFLRTLGREVAVFLSERRSAEILADQKRIDDYAKRFAFIAHDIKNVSNQLTLVLANAERNIGNPEFQRDMLFTLQRSVERINTLIARLREPQVHAAPAPNAAVAVLPRLRALARAQRHPVTVELDGETPGLAAVDPEHFEAAITHLLNNAVEASPPGEPVRITVRPSEGAVNVYISDSGAGMTPEFMRDELFRPLASSKPKGSGIGAWQARELLNAAGAALNVQSEVGVGTTFRLTLPAFAGMAANALVEYPA
ncbi:MAG TPA: ATP-binding protein [Acetobacteraceae bacterium]|nr:ATP-binding protein [Acetobacteraceae bacterium]